MKIYYWAFNQGSVKEKEEERQCEIIKVYRVRRYVASGCVWSFKYAVVFIDNDYNFYAYIFYDYSLL